LQAPPGDLFLQGYGQVDGRLASELNQHPVGLLLLDDVHHILQSHRLKKELVRGVVVCGYRLRIVVDYVGLYALLSQGHHGMNCAVVELYPLADANGPGAQDKNLLAAGGDQLTLHVIRGIIVGCLGRKLGGAGIHHLIGGNDAGRDAHVRDLLPALPRQPGYLLIGEAAALGLSKDLRIESRLDIIFHGQDVFHAVEEVGLYACDPGYLLRLPAPLQGDVNGEYPLIRGLG